MKDFYVYVLNYVWNEGESVFCNSSICEIKKVIERYEVEENIINDAVEELERAPIDNRIRIQFNSGAAIYLYKKIMY